jgi:hypothetical protein
VLLTIEEPTVKFDVILTNPPFQDSVNRRKTPHKLWIDFTLSVFRRLLKDGGSLVQVSPASFASPSNIVLELMTGFQTHVLRLDTGRHFPTIGSTFSDYWIEKTSHKSSPTTVVTPHESFTIMLDRTVAYLPNDISRLSLSVHKKVMFGGGKRLPVEWDYVTAHNIRRYDANPTLVETPDPSHPYPVFHTNRTTWWSSLQQEWATAKKVMWTRSGYTKPFYDPGRLGGTDMVYFVRVNSDTEGENLAHNLNSELMRYIYKTAKWSGFGNERVFSNLPSMPTDKSLSDYEVYTLFGISDEEVSYVRQSLGADRRKAQ